MTYAAAEIKPEPARTAVGSAVAAGIAFIKHARQILRRDAYSGVFDTKDFSLGINLYAPLAGIFERVREQLLDDERKPFFVRNGLNINAVIFEANPAVYKFRGEFFTELLIISSISC